MNIYDRPAAQKKRIAIGITVFVGVVLLGVLILYYRNHGVHTDTKSTQLSRFYTTIQQGAQSLFDKK
jgi:hypothetical protein